MSIGVGHHFRWALRRRQPCRGCTDALEALIHNGGEELRERMARIELHLERVMATAGAPLAEHANATIIAGGKRLRPLLRRTAPPSPPALISSRQPRPIFRDPPRLGTAPRSMPNARDQSLVRAAVAVELVPLGDACARRCDRRCSAAPWTSHRGCRSRSPGRDRHR